MPRERVLFVTGRLAEPSLRRVLQDVQSHAEIDSEIAVLKISVAALMHTEWVGRQLSPPENVQRVILPGWCQGELNPLSEKLGVPVERGPKDLFDLPDFLLGKQKTPPDLSRYDIEILAEINHAPRMTERAIREQAEHFRQNGADVIDLGCIPGEQWKTVGPVVKSLRNEGFRLSIDSFDQWEVETAVEAGAELVLSCNSSNIDWARHLKAELVAIPDDPHDLNSLQPTIDTLQAHARCFRIDPILEPIGFGFAASLARYYQARQRWPDLEMMMGIGNLTELTEVDSAGLNLLLAAICQELRTHSVLTTEVINWASSSVKEFDLARRLMRHSIENQVLPKHVNSQLVMLRDPRVRQLGEEALREIADQITDPSFRIFAERGEIHLMNREGYWHGSDPFEVFDRMRKESGEELDVSHAFYLGYELAKAVTAVTLGKQYRQDQALQWGFLTVPEISAQERRKREAKQRSQLREEEGA